LIEKPDNPIGFIVEFLQKKYPDQAGVVLRLDATVPARDVLDCRNEFDVYESSDNEEDSEDDMPKSLAYNRAQKRRSVCGEIYNDDQDEIKEFEKSSDERMRILEMLEDQVLFRHLENEQKDFIVRAMMPQEFKKGDIITKQGEDGDKFFVIEQGNVECLTHQDGSQGQVPIQNYGPGGALGELALMYNSPRGATCRAASSCRLYALNRKVKQNNKCLYFFKPQTFKAILMKTTIEKRLQIKNFLQNVEILKQLKERELFTMADAMQEATYEDGDVVCRQGDAGSNFYIIKQGTVTCTQADAQGKQQEVARLAAGDYFGEIALLTTKPRQASVIAAENNGALK